jgi:hypothetical protein
MTLRFVGIDPDTGGGNSPTVWVDEDTNELIIQGWKASAELHRQVADTPAPDHVGGVPEGEDIVRIPARMTSILRKACDAADGLG